VTADPSRSFTGRSFSACSLALLACTSPSCTRPAWGSDCQQDSGQVCTDTASRRSDLSPPRLELPQELFVGGGAGCRPATLGGWHDRGEAAATCLWHACSKVAAAWSCMTVARRSVFIYACYWGMAAMAGHDDLSWAWLSICNGSLSSAHELRAVADDEQLHMAKFQT